MYSGKHRFRLFRHPSWAAAGGGGGSQVTTYDTLTLANSGSADVCIAKYTDGGRVQWVARIAGSSGSEFGNGIAVDPSENIYVGGQFASTNITIYNSDDSAFATTLINEGTGTDSFLVKYDGFGNAVWATRIASSISGEIIQSVQTDALGNVYVLGRYSSNPVTIYNADGSTFSTLANFAGIDLFVVKYNTSGFGQWSTRIAGIGSEASGSISVDSVGNVFVCGGYSSNPLNVYNADTSTFGTLANSGSSDSFLVKYNSMGVTQWMLRIAGSLSDAAARCAVDSNGNIIVSGGYSSNPLTIYNADGSTFGTLANSVTGGDVFLVKYNASGVAQWSTRPASSSAVGGISIGALDSVYVAANYFGATTTIYNADTTVFGTLSLITQGGDGAVIKYNSSGVGEWAARIGGTSPSGDSLYAISTDTLDNAYVIGNKQSNPLTIYNADGGIFGTITPPPSTGENSHITKYNSTGTAQWTTSIDGAGTDRPGLVMFNGTSVHAIWSSTSQVTIRSVGF